MSKSKLLLDTPTTCGDCPLCIHTKEEKNYIGYCNTSDEDYYCKALDRFIEYDIVDGGLDILGKPVDCPLHEENMTYEQKSAIVISQLRADRDRLLDAFDKIRAEIEEQEEYRCFDEDDMFVYRTGLDDALEIIDKYKAESEDKE